MSNQPTPQQSVSTDGPSGPILTFNGVPIFGYDEEPRRCDFCGDEIEHDGQVCPALDAGVCAP